MSNLALSIAVATLFIGVEARAADLPSPQSPLPPTPVFMNTHADPWSGAWFGVYGGLGFANPKSGYSITGDPNDITPAIASQVDASGNGAISAKGFLGGVQGGWNMRLNSNYVIGVEADIGYAGLSGGRNGTGTIPAPYNAPYIVSQHYSTDWQAALRARLGYLINPATLLFVEGGPALGRIRYGGSFSDFVPAANYTEMESASASAVKVGLTLGGGVEYLIGPNLSLRADYLFTHFSSVNMTGTSNVLLPVPVTGQGAHSSGELDQNTFRIGLNYMLK